MLKKASFILLAIMLLFSNCKKTPVVYDIYYTVTGASENAGIAIDNGSTIDLYSATLPYTSNSSIHFAGETLSITAWYQSYSGSLTINIYKDGVLWKTATSIAGGSANASGVL